MRSTMIGGLAAVVAALAAAGCGSTTHLAQRNRPATPVEESVYVNNSRVSLAPRNVGAGPILFLVTNQASRTESITIGSSGRKALASTGPINPGLTAQVEVDFTRQGAITVATSGPQAFNSAIKPTTIHIGAARAAANNALLQP